MWVQMLVEATTDNDCSHEDLMVSDLGDLTEGLGRAGPGHAVARGRATSRLVLSSVMKKH